MPQRGVVYRYTRKLKKATETPTASGGAKSAKRAKPAPTVAMGAVPKISRPKAAGIAQKQAVTSSSMPKPIKVRIPKKAGKKPTKKQREPVVAVTELQRRKIKSHPKRSS